MKHRNDEHSGFQQTGKQPPQHHPDWQGFIYQHEISNNGSLLIVDQHSVHDDKNPPARKFSKAARSANEDERQFSLSRHKDSSQLPKLKTKPPLAFVNGVNRSGRQEVRQNIVLGRTKKLSTESKTNRRSLPSQIAPVSERKKTQPNPYPRVPIVKIEDKYMNYGTFVYRGMNPRTSDRYFTTLKEADYNQTPGFGHWKDRLKEPLSFNSKFECGNLNYAIKVLVQTRENEYDLYIRVDTNTQGHRQWYFFSVAYRKVQGNNNNNTFRFNIFRFAKRKSLYRRGMRPYTFSKMDYQEALKKVGADEAEAVYRQHWLQDGSNVSYSQDSQDQKKNYYVLSFTYEFRKQGDQIYFAACPPYSYSYMCKQIEEVCIDSKPNIAVRNDVLIKTICGLTTPLLTISNSTRAGESVKKFIVLVARSHPGESSGSWVMDGFIQWLRAGGQAVETLLHKATLKIVPMMNPDGVFIGNYRTGIAGKDYNRNFNSGKADLFPEIEALKKLVDELQKQGEVLAFIDLHGHSILRNSFIFGPGPTTFGSNQLKCLPDWLSESSELFKLSSCRFRNQKEKIETARGYYQFRQRLLSFTLENSLGLVEKSDGRTYPIGVDDWRLFGEEFGYVVSSLLTSEPTQERSYVSTKLINKIEQSEELSRQSSNNQPRLKSKKVDGVKTKPIAIRPRKLSIRIPSQAHHQGRKHIDTDGSQLVRTVTDLNRTTNLDLAGNMRSGLGILTLENMLGRISRRGTQQVTEEETDKFTEGQDSDNNDEDSEDEDLAPELLEPVLRAIELRDYPVEAIRANSNMKTNEDLVNQTVEEQAKLQAIFHRKTNGFKEVKFNRNRLSPENNFVKFRDYYNGQGISERAGQSKQMARQIPRQTSYVSNIINRESGTPPQAPKRTQLHQQASEGADDLVTEVSKELRTVRQARLEASHKFNGIRERSFSPPMPLSLQKEISQQMTSEVVDRMRRIDEKRNSIFNQTRIFNKGPFVRTFVSPKSFGFHIKRKL